MLTIKCAACRKKIMKYKKIGRGQLLKCIKARIVKVYNMTVEDGNLKCSNCGNVIGIEKGDHYKMHKKRFTCSGKKLKR